MILMGLPLFVCTEASCAECVRQNNQSSVLPLPAAVVCVPLSAHGGHRLLTGWSGGVIKKVSLSH